MERFEFAIEKCTELGITNFKIYSADKSHKRGIKLERWRKILLSAMKQSLRRYIPKIEYVELCKENIKDDLNLIFDQEADTKFCEFLVSEKHFSNSTNKRINYFFGPEAGMTEFDKSKIINPLLLRLTDNRLRAETAIISAASLISNFLTNKY